MDDMRRLVAVWSDDMSSGDPVQTVMRVLGKPSLARARDTYTRVFRPRFMCGSPPEAWKLARVLEDAGADAETIKAFYYWITARSEKLLYDYVIDELMPSSRAGKRRITVDDGVNWLGRLVRSLGKEWSPTVMRKVMRAVFAALRDFGVMQGAAAKTIAPRHCPPEAFAIIAFCLHNLGSDGRALVQHSDWRLFLFDEHDVERSLLECHQRGWLGYQAAGAICRIDFPTASFKEYVRVVFGR